MGNHFNVCDTYIASYFSREALQVLGPLCCYVYIYVIVSHLGTVYLRVNSLPGSKSQVTSNFPTTTNTATTNNLILFQEPKLSFSFDEIIIYLVKDDSNKQV